MGPKEERMQNGVEMTGRGELWHTKEEFEINLLFDWKPVQFLSLGETCRNIFTFVTTDPSSSFGCA